MGDRVRLLLTEASLFTCRNIVERRCLMALLSAGVYPPMLHNLLLIAFRFVMIEPTSRAWKQDSGLFTGLCDVVYESRAYHGHNWCCQCHAKKCL